MKHTRDREPRSTPTENAYVGRPFVAGSPADYRLFILLPISPEGNLTFDALPVELELLYESSSDQLNELLLSGRLAVSAADGRICGSPFETLQPLSHPSLVTIPFAAFGPGANAGSALPLCPGANLMARCSVLDRLPISRI